MVMTKLILGTPELRQFRWSIKLVNAFEPNAAATPRIYLSLTLPLSLLISLIYFLLCLPVTSHLQNIKKEICSSTSE